MITGMEEIHLALFSLDTTIHKTSRDQLKTKLLR